MKLADWIKERVEEIRGAHPVEDWEYRKCDFDVVVDADGDVRLSGDTRVGFSLTISAQRQKWWHGGAGLTERSERGALYAVATHDLLAIGFEDWLSGR